MRYYHHPFYQYFIFEYDNGVIRRMNLEIKKIQDFNELCNRQSKLEILKHLKKANIYTPTLEEIKKYALKTDIINDDDILPVEKDSDHLPPELRLRVSERNEEIYKILKDFASVSIATGIIFIPGFIAFQFDWALHNAVAVLAGWGVYLMAMTPLLGKILEDV